MEDGSSATGRARFSDTISRYHLTDKAHSALKRIVRDEEVGSSGQ